MYPFLLSLHSALRWLVLLSLLYSIIRAYRGLRGARPFSDTDNRVRHWTATIAHIQLLTGMALYIKSPVVKYFFRGSEKAVQSWDSTFFALLHIGLMLAAIVAVTTGSALAKRKPSDREKFRTMLLWFSAALVIIFLAIPWPFSPLAARPLLRAF